MGTHRTEPDHSLKSYPPGIPFIIGNEGCERFSFYGMRAILKIYILGLVINYGGLVGAAAEARANEVYHLFKAAVYAFPMIGALLADRLAGKYATILWLSVVYCLGHLCLALMDMPGWFLQATLEPRGWLLAGLGLIAVGAGGIKPCVSAHVGDQFGRSNSHLLERVFGWFYFAINFGSFFSTLLTPWLLEHYGAGWAFGVPGILMAVATLVFWLVMAGPLTAVPLMMFAAAARRLRLATVGLFQYLSPSLQLAIGVAVFGEPFDGQRLAGFVLIWTGLAVYTAHSLALSRRASAG
jgi:dipeptide/tripeptide permease